MVDYFNETVNSKVKELRHANDVPTASQSSVVNETSVVLESCLEDVSKCTSAFVVNIKTGRRKRHIP